MSEETTKNNERSARYERRDRETTTNREKRQQQTIAVCCCDATTTTTTEIESERDCETSAAAAEISLMRGRRRRRIQTELLCANSIELARCIKCLTKRWVKVATAEEEEGEDFLDALDSSGRRRGRGTRLRAIISAACATVSGDDDVARRPPTENEHRQEQANALAGPRINSLGVVVVVVQ